MCLRRALRHGLALALLLAAGPTGAATLAFTGTLTLQVRLEAVAGTAAFPPLVVGSSGVASIGDDGRFHLTSLDLAGSTFGPATATLPEPVLPTFLSVRFAGIRNSNGGFAGLSTAPGGGGPMGVRGAARICLVFDTSCSFVYIPIPLSVTGTPPRGIGIGGTQTFVAPDLTVTLQNAPWTIGQPVITIHDPMSTVTTPMLPAGFAHGPASLTSSTAQASGVLQLVTVTKVFSPFFARLAAPEFATIGILNVHFVPEPGTIVLLASAGATLALAARRR